MVHIRCTQENVPGPDRHEVFCFVFNSLFLLIITDTLRTLLGHQKLLRIVHSRSKVVHRIPTDFKSTPTIK